MTDALQPENVAVVVNQDSWASVALADAYVRLRGIPAGNVITLSGLSSFETIGVDEFRQQILTPVLAALEARGLRNSIDCIAYSADIPYEINYRADLGSNSAQPQVGERGAVTGLTYLYEPVLARAGLAYTSLESNHYAHRAFVGKPELPFTADEAAALRAVEQLTHEKKFPEAAKVLATFCDQHPRRAIGHYYFAVCLALSGQTNESVAALERATDAGWFNASAADKDPALEPVRALPAWAKLRDRMEQNRPQLTVQPPRRFRAQTAWDAAGQPTTAPGGRRYMLSTMLGITSGRGTSITEAIAAIERATAADGTCPTGTIYYMLNGDIRTQTRRWGFEAAVRLLKEAGVTAMIEKGNIPQGRPDVAGAMVGIANFDFAASGSRILPGAICEHLTSGGGIIRWGDGQTPLTEFLRHGAAGASGTVTEPLAIQAKFPDPFVQVHYVRGASLAEAFYQSVTGPYQLLIVGDPLCRPWGKKRAAAASTSPRVELPGVTSGGRPVKVATSCRGFRMTTGKSVRSFSGSVESQPWGRTAEITPGSEVTVEGWVEVRTNDVYQFQVRSGGDAGVSVNGRALPATGHGPWQSFPVALEAGWHAVSLRLKAGGADGAPRNGPPLDLRFGAVGVPPLAPQLHYLPRPGDDMRRFGLSARPVVDEISDEPLSMPVRLVIEGLEPAVGGTLTMAWETPPDSGWSVEPAHAESLVTHGVCKPVAFQVRYRGEPFTTEAFFRLPSCKLAVRTDLGDEQANPVSLPLGRILNDCRRPLIAVARVAQPPKIDGVLDDAAWSGPATISRLRRPQLDRPTEQPTTAWLAWDDHGLYVAARCTEPELTNLHLRAKARDDATYEDDSVDFFVTLDPDAKTYYQIAVNAAGIVYDGCGFDAAWNGDYPVATGREAGAWTLELALPWTAFGGAPPKPEAILRVLMARNRCAGKSPELSTWPFAAGGNHQPALFGRAVLKL